MRTINIQAIIFDLDGIIIDSEPWQKKAFDLTVKPFHIHFNNEQFAKLIGLKTIDNFRNIIHEYHLKTSPEILTEIKSQYYQKILRQSIRPRTGLIELLNFCKGKYLLAVASNSRKEDVLLPLNLLKITGFFKVIKTGDDIIKGKPDPEIFLKTAEKLNIPAKNCLVIEDSEIGIQAAKKADMMVIAVPTASTKTHDFKQADHIFDDLAKISGSL